MKADLVARGAHVPTAYNTEAETRPRMFRALRIWMAAKSIAAILAGDFNAKKPLTDATWTALGIDLLAAHSVDHIYGNDEWEVLGRQVIRLRDRNLSDHDAVKVTLRHKRTGRLLTVASANLKHHWAKPHYRAAKILLLLNADLVICQEGDEAMFDELNEARGHRAFRARSNSFPWVRGWTGNLIVWRTSRLVAVRRRSRPTFFIYLKGKRRQRRPRIPVPAVNWSPIVWFAFVPEKKEN